jgi:polysaccharide deacetylase family protein (PEP-CTERM system associated)
LLLELEAADYHRQRSDLVHVSMSTPAPLLLLGIDLEDVRLRMPDGDRFAERVPETVRQYLEFFARHGLRTTFFAVGDVVRAYPALLKEIAAAGHEVACHTDAHIPLDQLTPVTLREDLLRAHESFERAGLPRPVGFRAPVLSLVESSQWAYGVLAELGYRYSSSVLPARNPLYGWPEFGRAPRTIDGIVELPVSLLPAPLGLPFAAGVYFRALPYALIHLALSAAARRGQPVVGYLHPYDVDTKQERFMHPGINGSRFNNALMYFNRKGVFPRLASMVGMGYRTSTYLSAVERMTHGHAGI